MGARKMPITAVSLSSSLPLKQLSNAFPAANVTPTRTHVIAEYEDQRTVFCFDFGAVVFVDVSEPDRQKMLEEVTKHLPDGNERVFQEDFIIELDPELQGFGAVHFHHLVVPKLTNPIAQVIALLLAQSATVERYEVELDQMIAALQEQTQGLSKNGRIGARRKAIMRLVAKTIATRNRIIGKLSLLDKPELAWESEQIDHLHDQLRPMLEIGDRFRAVEYKLRAVHETAALLLNLMQTQQALLLEATIVVLIAVEIGLALFKLI